MISLSLRKLLIIHDKWISANEVFGNGAIQVNGKTVSKILVDGRAFFGGDQQIATKNLPANIIDKVQVSDDAEAKRRDPDLIPANTPQVINLKLKKAFKQGAFGKLYAGGGLKELYETGGIMNFFRDTTQVSLLAYGNNVNKPGFDIRDIAGIGGFERSGINSIDINKGGGYAIDGISFGGISDGIQTSSGAGANFNTVTKKGLKINGRYFFGQGNNIIEQLINNDQTLGENRLITTTTSNQQNKSYTHNLGAKIEWEVDTLTKITINPSVTLNINNNNGFQNNLNTNQNNEVINKGESNSKLDGNNNNYTMSADLWKDFKKKGRSLNAFLYFNKQENFNDNFNNSISTFYVPPSSTSIDQLRDNNIRHSGVTAYVNYSEPLSKMLTLSLVEDFDYLDNENALATFYKDPLNQSYDLAVPDLSETVKQSGIKNNITARLKWNVTKDLNIQPGVTVNTINLNNRFVNYNSFKQDYNFVAPLLNIEYKDFSLDYTPSFIEPDVQYIQPVANNTDPLFIQNGNADLLPGTTHQIRLSLYKHSVERAMNYYIYIFGSINKNAVVMSRVIDDNGVQINTPINANGIWRYSTEGSIKKGYKNSKRQITIGLTYNASYNKSIVMVNNIKSNTYNFSLSPSSNIGVNFNDKFELNENYLLSINNSTYDDPFYSDLHFLTHSSETNLVIRYPKKIVWDPVIYCSIITKRYQAITTASSCGMQALLFFL